MNVFKLHFKKPHKSGAIRDFENFQMTRLLQKKEQKALGVWEEKVPCSQETYKTFC